MISSINDLDFTFNDLDLDFTGTTSKTLTKTTKEAMISEQDRPTYK